LRFAIQQSNSTPGPNEIDFAPGLSGTIGLNGPPLTINTNDVTIVGPGSGVLTVSGNNIFRVFEVDGVNATISGLTITGGRFTGSPLVTNVFAGGINVVGGGLTLTGGEGGAGNQSTRGPGGAAYGAGSYGD